MIRSIAGTSPAIIDSYLSSNGSSARIDRLLLAGGACTGKTSLLFDAAVARGRIGQTVLYLCSKERMEKNLPLFFRNASKSVEGNMVGECDRSSLENIKMKYLNSRRELLFFLSNIHQLTAGKKPSIVLIDDLDIYLTKSPDYEQDAENFRHVLYGLAMLEDSMNFVRCPFIASITISIAMDQSYVHLFRQRFSQFFTLFKAENDTVYIADNSNTANKYDFCTFQVQTDRSQHLYFEYTFSKDICCTD